MWQKRKLQLHSKTNKVWGFRILILWFQTGFELFLILILIALGIKFSKEKNIVNDKNMLKIVKDELVQDGFDHYELK